MPARCPPCPPAFCLATASCFQRAESTINGLRLAYTEDRTHPIVCADGPSDAGGKMRILTGRSIAIMCPASHEGVPRQVISSSASPSSYLRAVAHFNCLPRWSSRHSRALPCKPHIRRDDVPTTVPHSGRESSRRTAPLFWTAAFAPGRTTATPPWIRMPGSPYSPSLIRPIIRSRASAPPPLEPRPGSHTATTRSAAAVPSPPP